MPLHDNLNILFGTSLPIAFFLSLNILHLIAKIHLKDHLLTEASNTTSGSPSQQISQALVTARLGSFHKNQKCVICHYKLNRPMKIRVCQHVFCNTCIHAALACDDACPICRVKLFGTDVKAIPVVQLPFEAELTDMRLWYMLAKYEVGASFMLRLARFTFGCVAPANQVVDLIFGLPQRATMCLTMLSWAVCIHCAACQCMRQVLLVACSAILIGFGVFIGRAGMATADTVMWLMICGGHFPLMTYLISTRAERFLIRFNGGLDLQYP